MADPPRDKEHLGVDTNVLVAFLDKKHPEHATCSIIEKYQAIVNPTVVHEAYHTLVFKQMWEPQTAGEVLKDFIELEEVRFQNQTKATVKTGLTIGVKNNLGGRDALILANFLIGAVPVMATLDQELLTLKEIKDGNKRLRIVAPSSLR